MISTQNRLPGLEAPAFHSCTISDSASVTRREAFGSRHESFSRLSLG